MGKLFGTDGVRGIVNSDLNILISTKLGVSVAHVIKEIKNKSKLTFLIGSDTRISKDMLTMAVSAGVLSEGCNIIDVGVLPTPAISFLVGLHNADGAFIISASHNPSKYNGIKVLDENGFKLSEKVEEKVEEFIINDFKYNEIINDTGNYKFITDGIDEYVAHLKGSIIQDISNLKIVVDVANGAAYKTAQKLFSSLHANFDIINNNPDGININENAGSTHINSLCEIVKQGKYDVGIAYDGDADRCIMVDELGNIIDGDKIIAICGNLLKKENKLKNNTLVGTIMSNMGLIKFCEENDIKFVSTKVGDKYVLEQLIENDYILGGEQSGHVIFKEYANTGDGELTSLQILSSMCKENKKLSELALIMTKYPQVIINVKTSKEGKKDFANNKEIINKISEIEASLNDNGRVLVRPSGTEDLIRVMIEGKNEEIISKYCEELASFISIKLN